MKSSKIAFTLAYLLLSNGAFATSTWTGNGSTSIPGIPKESWDNISNWESNLKPTGPSQVLDFPALTNPAVNFLSVGSSSGVLTVDQMTISTSGNSTYQIVKSTFVPIQFAGGSILIDGTGSKSPVLDGFQINGVTTITSSVFSGSTPTTLRGFSGSSDLILNAPQSSFSLSSNDSYSGVITLAAGTTLIANGFNALGSGAIIMGANTTLNAGITTTLANNITLGGGTQISTEGNSITLNGAVSGSQDLTKKASAGTLVLAGANTYTGDTIINGGTLQVGNGGANGTLGTNLVSTVSLKNSAALAFNRTDSITVANTISDDGILPGGTLAQNGTGTLILTGVNGYAGGTTISAGILSISSLNNIGSGAVTLAGGTLSATASISPANTFSVTGNSIISSAGTTILSETLTGSNGRTLTLVGNNSLSTINVNGTDLFTIVGAIGGVQPLTKIGGGTLVLSGSNSYSNGTAIKAGILSISSTSNIGSDTVTLGGGTLTPTNGTLQATGAMNLAQAITLVPGGGTLDNATGADVTLSGLITGSSSFTKTSGGKVTLNHVGNAGSAWATNLNGGTLSIASAGNIGTGPFSFDGGTLEATGAMILAQAITLNGGGGDS